MSGQKEAAEENVALRLLRDEGGTGKVPSGLIMEAEEEKGTLGREFMPAPPVGELPWQPELQESRPACTGLASPGWAVPPVPVAQAGTAEYSLTLKQLHSWEW